MIGWILAVLTLFVVQTLIAPTIRNYSGSGSSAKKFSDALGARDNPPPMPVHGERAHRALKNMFEALPVFLTLAILIHVEQKELALAQIGAAIFFVARLAYVPTYMLGIYALRTGFWLLGWVGLLIMLAALLK